MDDNRHPEQPILLVDDERPWLHSMSLTLERHAGLDNILLCSDSSEVRDIIASRELSLVLLDLTMPPPSGEELLALIRQEHPELPVIVISGINQIDSAVSCMKLGAFDYFVKTDDRDRIMAGVQRALRMRELQRENELLRRGMLDERLKHPEAFEEMLTQNPQMHAVFHYIEAVATSSQPVLITGESGTGKELAAHAVHRLGRPNGPWVAVNAAGLDDNVFSDSLFGHTKGAFTGADQARSGMIEQAKDGTLFLDEIGDLSPASQVKLLRLLQEDEYLPLGADRPKRSYARIVVATNHDLSERMASGAFRKDLYYRLKAHHVLLPPLRERLEDLPLLLPRFLQEAAKSLGRTTPTPPPELQVLLSTYHFPGNVRELRAMVYDAVSLHQSGKLSMNAFKKAIGRNDSDPVPQDAGIDPSASKLSFGEALPTLEEAGSLVVVEAMERAQGNQTIASGMLGISRPALSKRLKKMRDAKNEETP